MLLMYDVLLEMKELSGKLQSPKLDYLKAAYDLIKAILEGLALKNMDWSKSNRLF